MTAGRKNLQPPDSSHMQEGTKPSSYMPDSEVRATTVILAPGTRGIRGLSSGS